jgi:hypothetical protein
MTVAKLSCDWFNALTADGRQGGLIFNRGFVMSTQTGVMKGSVTEVGAEEIKYLAEHVGRDESQGQFNVWGLMPDPEQGEVPGGGKSISFSIDNNDLPSGRYDVSSHEVSAYYIIQPFGPVFHAEEGYVTIQRHPGEPLRINGLMDFRARAKNGRHVDVRVVYEIEGVHVPPGRKKLQD